MTDLSLPRGFTVGELKALPPGTVLDTTTNFRWLKLVKSTPMTEGAWMFAPLPEERRGWTGGVFQVPRPDPNGPIKAVYPAGSLAALLRILEMADAKPRAHGVALWIALPFDEDARADLIRVAEENEVMVRGVIREVGRAATGHLYDIADLGLSANMIVAELGAVTRSNPIAQVRTPAQAREDIQRAEATLRGVSGRLSLAREALGRLDREIAEIHQAVDDELDGAEVSYQRLPELRARRAKLERRVAELEAQERPAMREIESYGIQPWSPRSNPANLSEADERELDQLVGRIGDNIAETVQTGRHGWSSLEQAINLHRDHAEVEWREHGGAAPFASIWPHIQAQVRRELGSIRDRFARSNPAPMEVQALLFDRELWTPRRAEAWLRRHDYAGLDLDEKPNTYRYRQHDPDLFRPRSFRTIAFGAETGIQAVVGKRKRGVRYNPVKLTEAQERALVSMPDRPHAYTELPKRTGLALCRAGLAEAKSFGYATLDQPVGAERFERTQRRALEFTLTDKGRAYRAALKSRA